MARLRPLAQLHLDHLDRRVGGMVGKHGGVKPPLRIAAPK
jgi:hypothetical protein